MGTEQRKHFQLLIPALHQTLLFADTPGWAGTEAFSHPSVPSWAHQHCFYADAAKYSKLLPRKGFVSRKSVFELQLQASSSLEQLTWAVEGHQSLHQRLRIFTVEITEENSSLGFFPISPAICCPLFQYYLPLEPKVGLCINWVLNSRLPELEWMQLVRISTAGNPMDAFVLQLTDWLKLIKNRFMKVTQNLEQIEDE